MSFHVSLYSYPLYTAMGVTGPCLGHIFIFIFLLILCLTCVFSRLMLFNCSDETLCFKTTMLAAGIQLISWNLLAQKKKKISSSEANTQPEEIILFLQTGYLVRRKHKKKVSILYPLVCCGSKIKCRGFLF